MKKKALGKFLKKGEIAQKSNFTFFHNVFYAICTSKSFNSHISVVVCSFFEFGTVSKWCIREWVRAVFSIIVILYLPVHLSMFFYSYFLKTDKMFFPSLWLLFHIINIIQTMCCCSNEPVCDNCHHLYEVSWAEISNQQNPGLNF